MKNRLAIVLLGFLCMSLANTAVADERPLPQPIAWEVLGDMTYRDDGRTYHATFSPRVKRLKDQEIILAGYMIPVEAVERHSSFILTGLPLAGCSFCGDGEDGTEVYVDVTIVEPIRFSYDPIVIKGKLTMRESDELGLFYQIYKAKPAELAPEEIQMLLPPVPKAPGQPDHEEPAGRY